MVRVEYEGVTKRFGDVEAVVDFDLGIRDREFRVLLGPSGSGKTTLLNITAGLERADSGSVLFDGQPVDDIPPERDVAMMFQSYA